MRGLLEEAHAHLERATKALETAADESSTRHPAHHRIADLLDATDDLASRVSNLVREVRP